MGKTLSDDQVVLILNKLDEIDQALAQAEDAYQRLEIENQALRDELGAYRNPINRLVYKETHEQLIRIAVAARQALDAYEKGRFSSDTRYAFEEPERAMVRLRDELLSHGV